MSYALIPELKKLIFEYMDLESYLYFVKYNPKKYNCSKLELKISQYEEQLTFQQLKNTDNKFNLEILILYIKNVCGWMQVLEMIDDFAFEEHVTSAVVYAHFWADLKVGLISLPQGFKNKELLNTYNNLDNDNSVQVYIQRNMLIVSNNKYGIEEIVKYDDLSPFWKLLYNSYSRFWDYAFSVEYKKIHYHLEEEYEIPDISHDYPTYIKRCIPN